MTNTTAQVHLKVVLDSVDYSCQVIDANLSLPGTAAGETVEVACPDGVVVEPGDMQDGAFKGTVFADTLDTGVTWALIQAYTAGTAIDYEITWFADLDATQAFVVSGQATVGTVELPWSKPGYARHPIDLVLHTAAVARPTP